MMNGGTKATILFPQNNCCRLQTALFHSTPILERKKRNFASSEYRSNYYSRRSRNFYSKQSLLREGNVLLDYLLGKCKYDFDEEDAYSSRDTSWFRKQYCKRSSKKWPGNQGSRHWVKKGFQFYEDDYEFETIFQSGFGGFHWSFINEESSQWRSYFGYSNNHGRWRRYRVEEEYNSSSESDSSESNLTLDRIALGLSPSGPLKIEDVKTAYRACALKWHPDRHQGSSKVITICKTLPHMFCTILA
uniref:Heat shock protein binding protein n=1 Tax=Rhizophora mucronata TaxID=61149 RepID=A0A2P2IR72_RHIMU